MVGKLILKAKIAIRPFLVKGVRVYPALYTMLNRVFKQWPSLHRRLKHMAVNAGLISTVVENDSAKKLLREGSILCRHLNLSDRRIEEVMLLLQKAIGSSSEAVYIEKGCPRVVSCK